MQMQGLVQELVTMTLRLEARLRVTRLRVTVAPLATVVPVKPVNLKPD